MWEMAVYATLAILAAIVLVYGTVAGRLERTPLSGALVFTGIGLLLGPVGLGVLQLRVGTDELRLLAELTLALVLFVDNVGAQPNTLVADVDCGACDELAYLSLALTAERAIQGVLRVASARLGHTLKSPRNLDYTGLC